MSKQNPFSDMDKDYIMRVAIYIRVSTEEQALFGGSLQAQEEALVEYAKENNMRVVGVYRDEGVSGGKPIFKRPALAEMLEDVKADKFDMILFTKLDRYFRNVREYFKAQEILENHKVAWKAIHENYDTITANGEMAVTMFLAIAEAERKKTSERIKFVLDSKRKRKELAFGGFAMPYGYTSAKDEDGIRRLVKDPETEPIVQDFWDHLRKYNSSRLAGIFCNEKYSLKRVQKSWANMARNEIYTGIYKGVEGYCEPYISRAEWEYWKQSHLTIKKTQKPERVYLFTGLIRCPECGHTLKGTFKTYPNDRSIEYKQYRCNRSREHSCPYRRAVSQLKLEKYLLANIQTELEAYITKVEVEEKNQPKKKRSAALDVVKLTEQLKRLNKVYMAGNIDDDEYFNDTAEIKKKIDKARQAEQDERPPDLEVLKSFLTADFATMYNDLDMEDKRRVWRSIISEIHLEKDSNKVKSIKFRA